MEIDLFSPEELPVVMRVLRTALNRARLEEREKKFLETYAKITGFEMATEPTIIPVSEVPQFAAHKAKRLVQLAAIAALLANPLRKLSVDFVADLARALKVKEPVVPVLYAVLAGKKIRARILTARRGARMILGEAYRREGVLGVLRFFTALIWRVSVNKDKIWNYKRLGLLPEGTLGREYWKHITELGFGFPGEPGGIPETIAYHDVSHVLNGYDTTPAGEIQQGSFQGGSRREGGFGFVQFVILQFHHGIKITPVAEGEVGNFNPSKVLWAIYRGSKFKYDVTHGWNYWPLMEEPLAQARSECSLLPAVGN